MLVKRLIQLRLHVVCVPLFGNTLRKTWLMWMQGTADVLVSAGMAAATGLRSGAGRLMTKISHAPPPPYHRLVHGCGIHSRTSPDPSPSTPKKVLDSTAFEKAIANMAYITLVSAAINMHFWVKPKLDDVTASYEALLKKTSHQQDETLTAMLEDLRKKSSYRVNIQEEMHVKTMHSHQDHVKELEATIMDLKAEIAELKIALEDSARSQGKV